MSQKKKWMVLLIVIGLMTIASAYIFIPRNLVIGSTVMINCTPNGVNRFLSDTSRWAAWWPAKASRKMPSVQHNDASGFAYDNYRYHLSQQYYNSIEVTISHESLVVPSRINIIKLDKESVAVEWQCRYESSMNPLRRMLQYQEATRIKANMVAILGGCKSFLEKTGNVYGFNIVEIISKDSILTSTRVTGPGYPTTAEIYQLIHTLENHIATEGARINDAPMLHVRALPGHQYETIVAIPTNKRLKETATIVNKRFVPWKTLVADVKGGNATIQKAMKQMEVYIQDYQRMPMAIPFESLITDRSRQPDTTKWITRICQPVS